MAQLGQITSWVFTERSAAAQHCSVTINQEQGCLLYLLFTMCVQVQVRPEGMLEQFVNFYKGKKKPL